MQNATYCNFHPLEWFTGDWTPLEKADFEAHISQCSVCRSRFAEIKEAWEAIPHMWDVRLAPKDLKIQVMDHIFGKTKRYRFRQWAAGIVVVAILAFGISGWALHIVKPKQVVALDVPYQIEDLYRLAASSSDMAAANGIACTVQTGKGKQLVIYVYDLVPTSGSEVYQAWLLKDGFRTNAGTFHVTDRGMGVLTYPLDLSGFEFDSIGITLEPDSLGKHPRGIKILGS